MSTTLEKLCAHGQSPWVDYLSRRFVRDGDLQALVDKGVRGLTSNPTIFRNAIAEGDAYDAQLRDLVRDDPDPKNVFLTLAGEDVRAACDILRPVFDGGLHGWVSLEVDPRLAHDTEATIAEAVRLHALVDRPNLMVKIPGTTEGMPAIEETIAAGIPVNVTLLFSLARHREAATAYLRGLSRLVAAGGDPHTVGSVASFFVSRVDTEADRRLSDSVNSSGDDLLGTVGVANARLAYQTYLEMFSGPEWDELAAAGATPQWCLWASTSMKDPDRRDVFYVEQLIGPETVDTMPRETAEAFLDHGSVADTLAGALHARETLERFAAASVDYDDVTATLEREGVEKFRASFQELLDVIVHKRDELLPA
ncbi:transaldolase [Kutzneria buriramensis]|uniref:Transaldolase n=1 Tax=Kutzneria buriramensis TaxID=1045776 RepID=A0A3E0H7M8_9PSEU|nr:transaldolase [Kutzneria buriramensis]REH39430.1 transaldolase [Kutzneria buriramensis]